MPSCIRKFHFLDGATCSIFQDAQDLGISIELLPLSCPDEEFNVSAFYAVRPSCLKTFYY